MSHPPFVFINHETLEVEGQPRYLCTRNFVLFLSKICIIYIFLLTFMRKMSIFSFFLSTSTSRFLNILIFPLNIRARNLAGRHRINGWASSAIF